MADKRVIDLTEKSTVDNDDYLIVDNATGGTKKLQISTLLASGKYEQKGSAILFELPSYMGSDTRFNFELEITIGSNSYSINLSNVGFGENRIIAIPDKPLIYVELSELIMEESNRQYGQLYIFAPTTMTLSASLDSFDICADIRIATLAAGATTVTFTNVPTTGNNLIELYTSKAGLEYTAVDDSTAGSLVYTFEAQSAAVTVYLVIREVS